MSAGTFNLYIEQNATFQQQVVWSTNTTPATPIDVTGYTAKMQIRAAVGLDPPFYTLTTLTGATPVFTNTNANGGLVVGTTDGSVTILIPDTITNTFTWVTGVYDLDIVSPTGYVTRLIQGTVTVSPAVTTIASGGGGGGGGSPTVLFPGGGLFPGTAIFPSGGVVVASPAYLYGMGVMMA